MTNSPNGLTAHPGMAELQALLMRHLAQADRLESQLRSLDLHLSHAVGELIAAHYPSVVAHSQAVRKIAGAIAVEMALSVVDRKTVHSAALLHDVGKVGIAASVRIKDGPLNDVEWVEMRRHPSIGHALLAQMSIKHEVLLAVRHHHERFDGAGYPDGLVGTAIPLAARIIAVADSFHAMTSDRPYRGRCTIESARAEIVRCSATQFCPSVVDAFLQISVSRRLGASAAA